MKRQKISDEMRDSIGLSLLASGKLTPDDIDQLAAKPYVFLGVRRRIRIERENAAELTRTRLLRWAPALTPILAAILITGFVHIEPVPDHNVPAVETRNEIPRAADEDASIIGQMTGAVSVQEHTAKRSTARQVRPQVPRQRAEHEEIADFYALTYDNDEDTDVRLIRAELPRSSLIAMGLNLHLESDNEKVKTDLLVGADGVPRAIRIVK